MVNIRDYYANNVQHNFYARAFHLKSFNILFIFGQIDSSNYSQAFCVPLGRSGITISHPASNEKTNKKKKKVKLHNVLPKLSLKLTRVVRYTGSCVEESVNTMTAVSPDH